MQDIIECEHLTIWNPHPCPYQEEINGNPGDYCNCCEECMQECRYAI